MKIFLGGTCNEDNWRDEIVIPVLKEAGIDYFNPVVEDWTEECQAEEERQKEICDVHLYVITNKMKGIFSIVEMVHSTYKRPNVDTVILLVTDGFDEGQKKSFKATVDLLDGDSYIGHIKRDKLAEAMKLYIEKAASKEWING